MGTGRRHMVGVGMKAEIKGAFMMANRDFYGFERQTPSGLPTMTPLAPRHG